MDKRAQVQFSYISKEIAAMLYEIEAQQQLASTCTLMITIPFVYLPKALERLTSQSILRAKGQVEVIPGSLYEDMSAS